MYAIALDHQLLMEGWERKLPLNQMVLGLKRTLDIPEAKFPHNMTSPPAVLPARFAHPP